MMSFMGSIGSMMKGSGLEEALETVHGPNAVIHMISGKAVSRALRGHFLVQAALVNKLMLALLPRQGDHSLVEHTEENHGTSDENPTPEIGTSISSEHKLDAGEIQKIHDLYEEIQDKSVPVSDIAESKELIKLEECLLK